jgi:hypothetical protein
MGEPPSPRRFVLRDLPLAARVTLAAVLISIGIGYVSALIQLHMQHASPGEPLPTPDDAVRTFHGPTSGPPMSKFETLLVADENLKFNGSGQMSAAFTTQSGGWKSAIKEKARQLGGRGRQAAPLAEAEKALRAERDTQRQAVIAWVQEGASKEDYEKDCFPIHKNLADKPMSKSYLKKEGDQQFIKIQSIISDRCVRCHVKEGSANEKAAKFPMDTYDALKPYVTPKAGGSAMSLTSLAQTTHVHLLGFSMLYGITGLIFAFTTWPALVRLVIAPLPLLAQVADIACWWLARLDAPHGPTFAKIIPITGGIVALGLMLHIVLSLFNLFGRPGKVVLVLLILAAGGVGYVAKERVIDPYIAQEKAAAAQAEGK